MNVGSVSNSGFTSGLPKSVKTQDDARNAIKDNLKNIGIDLGDRDLSSISGKDITNAYIAQSMQISFSQFNTQGSIFSFSKNEMQLNTFLGTLGKLGDGFENLQNLTPTKAKELISEDGYWGSKQTGDRIAGFVLAGAGDDIEKLKAGREGIMRGFKDADKTLGGFSKGYADIANATIERAVKAIDDKIAELGGNVVDIKA
ncbi:hydrogenase-4 component G [Campylobacter sp. RM9333]|uniref:hydrogenase-4 component G n=1 Tax=Campylobacter sp. RM9333 TaxID=2735731 RepID=UPI001D1F7138|nr:hydrogenase-4 component G [Campylobacter sp. RM9333]